MKKSLALIILISILLLTGCKGESTATEEAAHPQMDASEVFQILKTKAMQTAWAQLTLASVFEATSTPQPESSHEENTAGEETAHTAYPVEETKHEETPEPTSAEHGSTPEETHPSEETHEAEETNEPLQHETPVETTPAPTEIPAISTFTPFPENSLFRCRAQLLSPTAAENITAGESFETIWQITNNGSAIWEKDSVDLVFVDGSKLHTSVEVFDMNINVNPGETINLTIPMRAPDQTGVYQTAWALKRGTLYYCPLNVIIQVSH